MITIAYTLPLLITLVTLDQMNWQIEVVDTIIPGAYIDCIFNDITLDNGGMPHIVYNRPGTSAIVYASRLSPAVWQREPVDNGLYNCYGFSLIIDRNNTPHLSYYRQYVSLGITQLCHAYKSDSIWQIEIIDSITGYLGNYFWYIKSSINIDTSNRPGIAYIAWNAADSIHYVKYAHFNGATWDTSIVEYDSAYMNIQQNPSDWSPCLEFNNNTPLVAFSHLNPTGGYYDTLKLAVYDDTSCFWMITPILHMNGASPIISTALSSLGYMYIAHCVDIGLCLTWWNGAAWQSEYTGGDLSSIGVEIDLSLDTQNNPHMSFKGSGLILSPDYCYKDTAWNFFWAFDTGSLYYCNINVDVDDGNCPHICYVIGAGSNGLKYAKGTLTGIEDLVNSAQSNANFGLNILPNPCRGNLIINFESATQYGERKPKCEMSLRIYDASGRLVKQFNHLSANQHGGIQPFNQIVWSGIDDAGRPVPAGVYFVKLTADGLGITKKAILLR